MKFRMLLSALLLAAGLVCVAGCGKKGDSNKSKETVEKPNPQAETPQGKAAAAFWDAMFVKCDVEAAKGMLLNEKDGRYIPQWIERYQKLKKNSEHAGYADSIAKAKVGNVTVKGDTAEVSMVFTCGDKKEEGKVVLKQVGDKWLVEGFNVDL